MMIYFFVGVFIGGIASVLLYSLVVAERINELELENSRLIDDLSKAEYDARKYKYTYRRVSHDWLEECEEKAAEQMFNDLDYKKCIKDGCIEFERHVGNVIEWLIEFDLEINTVYVSWSGEPKNITIAELRAINKQCEELGWI